MLNLPGINDAQYYTGSTVSTESLNRADAQMRNLLRVGGQLFDMAINAAQINEAVATGQATRASVEGLYGNILGANGRVIRTSMEGVSDMASDAWEALKNWIKEMIRKVQDFFLKYSVFIKQTKEELKKLKSYVSSRITGVLQTVTGTGDTATYKDTTDSDRDSATGVKFEKGKLKAEISESIKDRYDDEKILSLDVLNRITKNDDGLTKASELVAKADMILGEAVTKEIDTGELKLKLEDKVDEVLDKMLDVDQTGVGVQLTSIADKNKILTYINAYYVTADAIIKYRENIVKNYEKAYKQADKLKGRIMGERAQSLRNCRALYHQSLLIIFRISSEFRKSAKKLIKYLHAVLRIQSADSYDKESSADSDKQKAFRERWKD